MVYSGVLRVRGSWQGFRVYCEDLFSGFPVRAHNPAAEGSGDIDAAELHLGDGVVQVFGDSDRQPASTVTE